MTASITQGLDREERKEAQIRENPLNPCSSASCLTIEELKPSESPSCIALLKLTVGDHAARRKTEDFWNWKHHLNSFGESFGLCAWNHNRTEMAGLRVLMRWQFETPQGERLTTVRAVDTATHPDYQRRGIFSMLTRQAVHDLKESGVDLIFNTPNPRSLQGYLKLGWRLIDRRPMFVRVLRPLRILAGAVTRRSDADPDSAFERCFKPGVMTWAGFVERYGDDLPDLISQWESRRVRVGLRTPRSREYLDWRYGLHPHVRYGVVPLERDGRLEGFVIARPNIRRGFGELVLTELIASGHAFDGSRALLRRLVESSRADYVVAHFAEGTVERWALRRSGFVKISRTRMLFAARALNWPGDVFAPSAWDLSLGDLEMF